jgi:CHAT domain-containing protein
MTFALEPLPGAQREAGDLAALFGPARSALFRGPQADRLRLEAYQSDFTVVHLATHGVSCADEPLDSFVVLAGLDAAATSVDRASEKVTVRADPRFPVWLPGFSRLAPPGSDSHTGIEYPGLLNARTIINRFTLRADLVSLSACQTGLGRALGQGTIGFTRAFLAAGARSLLVSLWNVDDDSTRELMVAFYREYLRHGNKALALQRAMQSTRQHHPEPRYWAPFTLVGLAE